MRLILNYNSFFSGYFNGVDIDEQCNPACSGTGATEA
jgi:hypothetical protein